LTDHKKNQYAITVNIETAKNHEGVLFRYWSDHIGDDQAHEVARFMGLVLDAFINRPTQTVGELDLNFAGQTRTAACSAEDPMSPSTTRSMRSSLRTSLDTPANGPDDQTFFEKRLLAIWSALLGLPETSIAGQDSFFDLGGDSITAMKLAGEARDNGLSLTVADVFRNPSFDRMVASIRSATEPVRALDSELSKGNGTITTRTSNSDLYERFSLLAASNVDAFLQTSIVPQVCVFKGGISDVLPATDFQSLSVAGALLESRWMLNYFYLDSDGPLDLVRLKRACFRLVQALDILRTVFVPSDGRFLQVVMRTLRPAFHVVETDESLDDFAVGPEGNEPRLGEPFVEFTVVKHRPSSRHRLFLRISHAQYDGVCFPKILSALQAAYNGETVPSPPSFANYLRASAGSLTSQHYQHWRQLLSGSSMTEIVRRDGPKYHRNASGSTIVSLKKTVQLPPVESGHVTTATVVKAAWAFVLAQLSASADVVFGHTISGRNAAVKGVGNMVGPCLNLVPVRVQFGAGLGSTARQVFHQLQDQQIANMTHEVLGFREIIRHCTSWPRWTFFTSTVQHQNIDQASKVRLGDIDYKFGCASVAQEDFADLSVFSQPLGDDKYEIILSFAEGGAIPLEFAERALHLLCEGAQLFASNPDMELPSEAELCSKWPQLPFDEADESNTNDGETTAGLQHLSDSQQADLHTLVSTTWHQVLGLNTGQPTTTAEPTSTDPFDLDTSFFALGGDIIGLAQLTQLLGHQQPSVAAPRLEELIKSPTVRGHMALLARGIPAASPALAAESPAKEMQKAATFPAVPKLRRVDSGLRLAKVFGLLKRTFTGGVKNKGGDPAPVAQAT
jgi:aryl carrier-like protein